MDDLQLYYLKSLSFWQIPVVAICTDGTDLRLVIDI